MHALGRLLPLQHNFLYIDLLIKFFLFHLRSKSQTLINLLIRSFFNLVEMLFINKYLQNFRFIITVIQSIIIFSLSAFVRITWELRLKNFLVNLINCEILLLTSFLVIEKNDNFLKIGKEISLIIGNCSVLYYLIFIHSMPFISSNNGNFLLLKGFITKG